MPRLDPFRIGLLICSFSTSSAYLPKECVEYADKVTACISKIGAAGDAVKQSFETAKAQWATVSDKSTLAAGCKAASDAFTQTASALKC